MKQYNGSKSCALICAYNEEAAIKGIASETQEYVDKLVIVDDGSEDNTHRLAAQTGAKILCHETNKGKGKALQTGFNHFLDSDYDNIVTLDADGQHPPEYIPKFLGALNKGYDVVVGYRNFEGDQVPLGRRYSNKLDSVLLSLLTGKKIKDAQNGFRAFKKESLEKVLEHIDNPGFGFEAELLIKMVRQGAKIGWVDVPSIYSPDIKSHIKPVRHLTGMIFSYWRAFTERV